MTKSEAINVVLGIAEEEIGYLEKKNNSKLDSKTGNAGSANYTYGQCFKSFFALSRPKAFMKHQEINAAHQGCP